LFRVTVNGVQILIENGLPGPDGGGQAEASLEHKLCIPDFQAMSGRSGRRNPFADLIDDDGAAFP
jgi:hypothetical protein